MSHHQWTQEHLTWYVNDTLVGEEHARVHQHLKECVLCRQEYSQLKRIAAHVSSQTSIPSNPSAALAELQPQLEVSSSVGFFSDLLLAFRQTPSTIRYVMALQGAALLILAGIVMLPTADENPVTGYTTLSSSSTTHGDIRLVFDPQTTPENRGVLLESFGLELVGTVSDRGIATVKWSDKKREQTLEALRGHEAIVLAEAVGSGSE